MTEVWVRRLHSSEATREKLSNKHGLSEADVRRHVQNVEGLDAAWHCHPQRGLRLLVKVSMSGRIVLVVLYPRVDAEGEWNLGSAYPT